MKSRVQFKFPTPKAWGSNSPPPGRLWSSNSLLPGMAKVSNARGMPRGGMLKLRFDRYITPTKYWITNYFVLQSTYSNKKAAQCSIVRDLWITRSSELPKGIHCALENLNFNLFQEPLPNCLCCQGPNIQSSHVACLPALESYYYKRLIIITIIIFIMFCMILVINV